MISGESTMFHFEVPPTALLDQLVVPMYKVQIVLNKIRKTLEFRQLGELCDIASGTYVREYVQEEIGTKYIRVDSLREFIVNLNSEDLVYVINNKKNLSNRVIAKEGDLLLSRTGTLGKTALVFGPTVGSVLSQHVTRLTPKDNEIDPYFLAAYLNSEFGKMQISSKAFGSTRPELTHDALVTIEVPCIKTKDQRRIGEEVKVGIKNYYSFCTMINEAIHEYERAIGFIPTTSNHSRIFDVKNLGEHWIPRYHIPEYELATKQVKNEFNCEKLGKIAQIERGKGTRVSEYSTSGVPFIRTSSLINYSIDPFPDHYANYETYNEFSQNIQNGDILLSIEGKIGNLALLTKQDLCVFKNHIVRLRTKDSTYALPLFLYLSSRAGQIEIKKNIVVQSTIPGLSNRVQDIIVPISPKKDNSNFYEHLNNAIQLTKRALDIHDLSIIHLKNAKRLMTEAFEDHYF